MRRSRQRRPQSHEPSLVPMADMLTNTLGIVVFILIFTVLAASGTTIPKRLPIERDTKVDDVAHYVCTGNRVYPMPMELVRKIQEDAGKVEHSIDGFKAGAARMNGKSAQNEHARVTLIAKFMENSQRAWIDKDVSFEPMPGGGLAPAQVGVAGGFFAQDLARLDPDKTALIFFVKPDSIPVFLAARDLASLRLFPCNWRPQDKEKPLTFGLGGGFSGEIRTQ